ncbi:hypothetical protein Tco_0157112 [Tanacetum coccineum]
MLDLIFADSHNMVAYLEKSTENADFYEIVDFLSASPIHYALTMRLSMERATTTTASLDAERVSGVNTAGSGEDRLKIMELMEIYTKLSDRVLALENVKTAQDLEITSLKKRVKKLEKKKKARTPQLKRRLFKGRNEDQDEGISWFQEDSETQERYDHDIRVNTASTSITTASINITTAEPVTTASAPITTAGVSVNPYENESEKSKEKSKERGSKEKSSELATRPTKGVTMQEPSESGTRKEVPPSHPKDKGKAKMIKPDRPSKKKDQIKFDKEMAKRLVEELQAKLEEEERVAKQKEEDANIAEWDNIQAMMDADFELAARLQIEEQGELTIEERSILFVERMDERKRHFARLRAEEERRKPPIKT